MASTAPRSTRAIEREIAAIQRELEEVAEETADNKISVVRVDGLVLLKILKHCKQCVPAYATGQLLGLGQKGVMEITNSIPRLDEEEDSESYQIEMMKCLRKVCADTNTVGWYRSAFLGSCFNENMIESQLAYQSKIEESVVLVYDPLASATSGKLVLKAFRLSDAFMKEYSPSTFTSTSLDKNNLSFSEIFEELPVEISNSSLVNAYLWEIESDKRCKDITQKGLDYSGASFMEKNLDIGVEYLEEICNEQSRLQSYQRLLYKQQAQIQKRKSENASRRLAGEPELPEDELAKAGGPPQSRLEFMVTTNQIQGHCEQMREITQQNLTKLDLFRSLSQS